MGRGEVKTQECAFKLGCGLSRIENVEKQEGLLGGEG